MRTPTVTPLALCGLALTITLSGCSAGTPAPADPAEPESQAACEVGHWVLDVEDFSAQSEDFVVGQGIPITEFAMTGDGTLDIGDDGFLDGVVSLTTTGVLAAPGMPPVDVSVPSNYTFSGEWAVGEDDDTIDLTNWAQVADVGGADPSTVAPFIDFTDVPTVSSECTDTDLRLQGPDAPLSALWHRA